MTSLSAIFYNRRKQNTLCKFQDLGQTPPCHCRKTAKGGNLSKKENALFRGQQYNNAGQKQKSLH